MTMFLENDLMTVEQFVEEEITRLRAFIIFWNNQRKENKEQFPKELPPGEWDEQFRAFEEI